MFLPNVCNNPSHYTALLRRIMNIQWADKITNEELQRTTKQKPTEIQIKRRKWNWIGHALHKEAGAIEKTALDRNPQRYRRRGRPSRMR
jgi:replicative superfamily II helicase